MTTPAPKSNSSKYLKIYLWQGTALLLRFVSMFIVMPYLTKKPSIYGIYALCVSVTIFLSYADLGFLKASQKYAAECYIRQDRDGEVAYIGFGTFVLLVFSMLAAGVFFILGVYPELVITGLDTPEKVSTASSLLMTLAAFTPGTVLQRMVAIIFDIRLDTHVYQRISLGASVVTIASVFYFFGSSRYLIVPYFVFSQGITFLSVLLSLVVTRKRYGYQLRRLFGAIRFNREVYDRAHRLAYSGLYVMLVWVVFYEFDQLTIAKLLGAEKVALYAIGFTFATLFRSIFGIVFSPFMVRANHFVGRGDDEGLKAFCLQMVALTAPIVVFPTVAFAVVAEPFILSWVGEGYLASVGVARLLALVYALSFISYSTSMVLMAKERIREIYVIATILPVVFWLGVFCTFSSFGMIAFAGWKLGATLLAEAFYLSVLIKYLRMPLSAFAKSVIWPLVVPLAVLISALTAAGNWLPHDKSKINVLIVVLVTGLGILGCLVLQFCTSAQFRGLSRKVLDPLLGAGLYGGCTLRRVLGIKREPAAVD